MPRIGPCELCGRERNLTGHHLIPRTLHSNYWFEKNFTKEDMRTRKAYLCRDCHVFIHKQWAEKKLGRYLNTLDKLKEEKRVKKFITWVRKQK